MRTFKQPWLRSAASDTAFILMPPFVALLLVALFPAHFRETDEMPTIYWLVLIVFIDVAHVYSTLYRTYFNPVEFREKHSLLISIPVFCYVTGVICYNIDPMLFWRILAYLAVYHFIRQQYGFMRLYSRYEQKKSVAAYIDTVTIYASTLYPILFWHLSPGRNFNWFIEGDFLGYRSELLADLLLIVYAAMLIVYVIKEGILYYKNRSINIPRNMLITGTALSWFFGIVYFNGDMAFTTLNVISHGIPYMALIWFFEKQKHVKAQTSTGRILKLSFGKYGIAVFILILAILAYVEEGLWDGLIWKEHESVFAVFSHLPKIGEKSLLSLLVPLLALPQSTHYVLDGFIWREPATQKSG